MSLIYGFEGCVDWIRTQSAAVASGRDINLTIHPFVLATIHPFVLATHPYKLATHPSGNIFLTALSPLG